MTDKARHSPTLADVLSVALNNRAAAIYTALPGKVERYNAAERSVDVRPMVRQAHLDESGDRDTHDLPVVTHVPVCFPGAGDYGITFPIKKGDSVLLVFAHSAIEGWLTTGRSIDPGDDRHHDLSDAIAIPGLRPFKGLMPANEDALVIEADETRIGSATASDSVARKSDLDALLSAISGAGTSGGDGGATFKAAILAALAGWPGTSSVKVD